MRYCNYQKISPDDQIYFIYSLFDDTWMIDNINGYIGQSVFFLA